jgi:hypothetical protein
MVAPSRYGPTRQIAVSVVPVMPVLPVLPCSAPTL